MDWYAITISEIILGNKIAVEVQSSISYMLDDWKNRYNKYVVCLAGFFYILTTAASDVKFVHHVSLSDYSSSYKLLCYTVQRKLSTRKKINDLT